MPKAAADANKMPATRADPAIGDSRTACDCGGDSGWSLELANSSAKRHKSNTKTAHGFAGMAPRQPHCATPFSPSQRLIAANVPNVQIAARTAPRGQQPETSQRPSATSQTE